MTLTSGPRRGVKHLESERIEMKIAGILAMTVIIAVAAGVGTYFLMEGTGEGTSEYTVSFTADFGTVDHSSIKVKEGTFWSQPDSGSTLLFEDGQKVIVMPVDGYKFDCWSQPSGVVRADTALIGKCVSKSGDDCMISFKVQGKGSVTGSLAVKKGTTFNASGNTLTFSDGQKVTAAPDAGYNFSRWDPPGGTVTGDMTITAVFTEKSATDFTVTITAGTGGSVDKTSLTLKKDATWSSDGSTLTFSDGQKVTATADTGYTFEAWKPASGTVTGDVTISASFTGGGGDKKTVSFLFCDNFKNDGFVSTGAYTTFFNPIIPSIWIHGTGTDMGAALRDACKTFDNASVSISDGKITDINGVKDGNIYLWGWKSGAWVDKNSSGDFLTLNDLTIADYDYVAVVHGAADPSGTAPEPTSEPGKDGWYYGEQGRPAGTGKEVKFYLSVNFIYTTYETDVKEHSDPLTLLVPGIWIRGYALPGSYVKEAFTDALDSIGYDYNIDDDGFVNSINDCSGGNFLHSIWDNSSGDWYKDTNQHWFGTEIVDDVDFAAMTYGAWGGESGYDTPPIPNKGAGDYRWGY